MMRTLLGEMSRALMAEFGARRIYERLAHSETDPELSRLLASFESEERRQVEQLRALMTALGGAPRTGSWRRARLADLMALAARLGMRRFVLGICAQAEDQRSRWYGHFQSVLLGAGRRSEADVCAHLALTKRRHASALGAWVEQG